MKLFNRHIIYISITGIIRISFFTLIVFPYFVQESLCQESVNSLPEFKLLSQAERRIDKIQKDRFIKRKEYISGLIDSLDNLFSPDHDNMGDPVSTAKKTDEEILMLGDECLNLYSVAELCEKNINKLKRKGYKINNKCLKVSKKIYDRKLSDLYEKYEEIRNLTIEMLAFCDEEK